MIMARANSGVNSIVIAQYQQILAGRKFHVLRRWLPKSHLVKRSA
jgi:predicted transcriptional regulator